MVVDIVSDLSANMIRTGWKAPWPDRNRGCCEQPFGFKDRLNTLPSNSLSKKRCHNLVKAETLE